MQPERPSRVLGLVGYAAFLLIGWNAVLVPTLIRPLQADFRESDAGLALYYLVTAIAYAVGSFGGGLLTERIGRRLVLAAAGALLAGGLLGQGLAPTWAVFVGIAIPGAWGAGAIDGGVNGLFLAVYARRRGRALNLLHLFFALGALIAPAAVGQLVVAGIPWPAVFAGSAVAAGLIAILLAAQDMPAGRLERPVERDRSHDPALVRPAVRSSSVPLALLALGIALYVASEIGVSSWLVRFLEAAPLGLATASLSLFWGGLTVGRLLSAAVADWLDAVRFAAGSSLLAGLALAGAVAVPALEASIGLLVIAGFFFGPVYPMIMAIAGSYYPARIAAVSGGLGAAAIVGSIVYPPLVGVLPAGLGIAAGMLGAAGLAIGATIAILAAGALAGRRARARRPA